MILFAITLAAILLLVAIMAIGVIFGRRPITGSCGGLAKFGLECECENPCSKKLARMQQAQAGEAQGRGEQETDA